MSRIAGIVLAAGLSRRLGRPKQLLELDGKPLVLHVVERALASGLDEIVLVTGAHADRVQSAIEALPVRVVHNARHTDGMGTSLAAGVASLGDDVDAVVVLLSDQPSVSTGSIERAVAARRLSGAPVVMTQYGDDRGHPVLFGHEVFAELVRLDADSGGREIICAHRDTLVLVDGGADRPPPDVDTEEAWAELQARWHGGIL